MASKATPDAPALLERKLALLRELFALTQQGLLLTDLEELTPIQARQDALIAEVTRLDEDLAALPPAPAKVLEPWQAEAARVIEDILENGRALEARIGRERSRLQAELRSVDRQQRLTRYLEGARQKGTHIDLKK